MVRRCLSGAFRPLDRLPGLEPFDRKLEIRVGESPARRSRAGTLTILVVTLPSLVDDLFDLFFQLLEGGIVKTIADPFCEFLLRQLYAGHPLSHFGLRHLDLLKNDR
jgi:hypothetical protein